MDRTGAETTSSFADLLETVGNSPDRQAFAALFAHFAGLLVGFTFLKLLPVRHRRVVAHTPDWDASLLSVVVTAHFAFPRAIPGPGT